MSQAAYVFCDGCEKIYEGSDGVVCQIPDPYQQPGQPLRMLSANFCSRACNELYVARRVSNDTEKEEADNAA